MASVNTTHCWENIQDPSTYIRLEGEKYETRPFERLILKYPFVFEDDEETETYFISVKGETESFHYREYKMLLQKHPMLKQFFCD